MGDDSPGRQIYYDLLSLLYEHHPIRDAVVGTKESIAEITAKTLYDCHSVFYAPSNMVLCVEGDVEPERIAAIAEEILPKDKKSIPHADFGESEALVPAEKRKEREMPVAMPEFLIGGKLKSEAVGMAPKDSATLIRERLIAGMALRLLAGASSSFFTRLYADGTLTRDFDYEADFTAGTGTTIIGGQSPDPERVMTELLAEAKLIAEKGFDKAYFSRIRKAMIGGRLRGLEDFDGICVSLIGDWFDGYCTFDTLDILPDIRKEECEAWIAENITEEKLAMAVIRPVREA